MSMGHVGHAQPVRDACYWELQLEGNLAILVRIPEKVLAATVPGQRCLDASFGHRVVGRFRNPNRIVILANSHCGKQFTTAPGLKDHTDCRDVDVVGVRRIGYGRRCWRRCGWRGSEAPSQSMVTPRLLKTKAVGLAIAILPLPANNRPTRLRSSFPP